MKNLLALLLNLFFFLIAVFHRSEAKGNWDIDLNKSPPPSPRDEEESQIPLNKPSARSSSNNVHEIIGSEIENMVGVKIKYNFPPGMTKKEKKKVYNKVRYDKKVSKVHIFFQE